MSSDRSLDAIDRAILLQLSRNGRLTNVELAQRVGLSPPPCLRRVKRLREAGVIAGYRARIDPAVMGRNVEVVIAVDVGGRDLASLEEFERQVAAYDEVIEVRRMFGQPDFFIRVAVEDLVAYEKFLTGRLIVLPVVTRVNSHLTMKTVKSDD
ncbi:Lrp/AsnC family transcriptional regulator [Streptomyces sp. NPDC087901]|uniref:Lrp/AsnC family transcriptional regulator n=1 Tax=unclassified Streptomyces TaxID=2593676 RepID=UPI00331D8DA8